MSSLADRLVTACEKGDLPSAKAAIADGASVNDEGRSTWGFSGLPMRAAVAEQHHDVVVWLLSHGADANGDVVMWNGTCYSTTAILLLLIDAGGDVNRESGRRRPLFAAVQDGSVGNVRVLLAQPSLDLAIECYCNTPEQYAHYHRKPVLADMIAQEVRERGGLPSLLGSAISSGSELTVFYLLCPAEGETSDAGTTTALLV